MHVLKHGAGSRPRFRAFVIPALGGMVLLSSWWSMPGSAEAASYPPRPGCAVSGLASAGSELLQVSGTGFDAGSRVLVSLAGRSAGAVRADAAGSFQASWPVQAWAAGARITAADAGCSATAVLRAGQPGPAQRPEPAPPAGRADPAAAVIPAVPLTGVPRQLFLGLAGAVLLAGTALTGLAGRLGHRSERPPTSATSVAKALPKTPGTA